MLRPVLIVDRIVLVDSAFISSVFCTDRKYLTLLVSLAFMGVKPMSRDKVVPQHSRHLWSWFTLTLEVLEQNKFRAN